MTRMTMRITRRLIAMSGVTVGMLWLCTSAAAESINVFFADRGLGIFASATLTSDDDEPLHDVLDTVQFVVSGTPGFFKKEFGEAGQIRQTGFDPQTAVVRDSKSIEGDDMLLEEDFAGHFAVTYLSDCSSGGKFSTGSVCVPPVPEPANGELLATGLIGLLGYGWWRRRDGPGVTSTGRRI